MARRCSTKNPCKYPRANWWKQSMGVDWFNQSSGGDTPDPYADFDEDFKAVILAAEANGDTVPTMSNLEIINDLVLGWKADGTWAERDVIYNFITGDVGERNRNFALYNYKNPAVKKLTIVGFLTYDGQTGFWGNGTGVLKTGYIPSVDGVNYTLDDASFTVYCGNDIPVGDYLISAFESPANNALGTVGKNAGNLLVYRVNSTTPDTSYTNVNGVGYYHCERTGAALSSAAKNGAQVDTSTIASTSLCTAEVVFLATNIAGTISSHSNKNIGCAMIGGAMTALRAADYTTWNTFKTAIQVVRPNTLTDESTLVTFASHCWFARDKAFYDASQGKTYFGSVHNALGGSNYRQYIFELNNSTGALAKFMLGSAAEMDDHNEPSILKKAADSKFFACYSEHSGAVIRFRTSTNANSIAAWGAEGTTDPNPAASTKYTYPSCYEDAAGNIFIFFRDSDGINSSWSYIKSTDAGATFGGYTNFYANVYLTSHQSTTDKDIIHFLSTGHPSSELNPNYVSHFYFDCSTETFHQTDGTDITADIPLFDTEMTTIKSQNLPDTCWLEDIMIDGDGYPRVTFSVMPNSRNDLYLTKQLWYSEWNGTAWSTPHMIHVARVGYMESDETYGVLESPMYSPNSCFDRANINRIFAAKDVAGTYGTRCEIFEITRVSASSFTSVQKTFNSMYDQWRPFTVNHTQRNVFWLHKVMYNDWLNKYYQDLINATI